MSIHADFLVFGFATNRILPVLIDLTFKGAILLSLVAIGVRSWRGSSAAMRHTAWLIALLGLLALPPLSIGLPGWNILPTWMSTRSPGGSVAPREIQIAKPIDESPMPTRPSRNLEYSRDPIRNNPNDTLVAVPKIKSTSDHLSNQAAEPNAAAADLTAIAGTAPPQIRDFQPSTALILRRTDWRDTPAAWFVGIWLAGVAAFLLRLMICNYKLRQLVLRSRRVTQGRLRDEIERIALSLGIRLPIRLFLTCERRIPMTWGLFPPNLMLPDEAQTWDDRRLHSVLMHELAHVTRWDCHTQLLSLVACALHWWNPLAWMAASRMSAERELACDDVVLSKGISAADYAEHLVGVASGLTSEQIATFGALAMSCPSRLESRLLTLLNGRVNRRVPTIAMRILLVLVCAILVLPISMLHAVGMAAPANDDAGAGVNVPKDDAAQIAQAAPGRKTDDGTGLVAWSNPVDNLQFRLTVDRTDFESWELPAFGLEVRNQGPNPVTAAKAESLIGEFRKRPGLFFLFQDQHRRAPGNQNRWVVPRVRFDSQKLIGLETGKSTRLTVTVESLREESSPDWTPYALTPGRYTIGLGDLTGELKSRFITNAVTLKLLPPGIRKPDELAAWLKPIRIEGQSLEVGFIPNKTTLVWGEPIFVTMVVQNLSDSEFTFGFGGDYRATGRHERFQIKATDSTGKPLVDPLAREGGAFDGGGILMWRTAQSRDSDIETVDITRFREFPGPGEYAIRASFDLTPSWTSNGKQEFKVPIVTSYNLTILPHDPIHVRPVLDELFERGRRTGAGALTHLVDTICSFGKNAAVPGLAQMLADQDLEHRIAAATGLGKIATAESLEVLLKTVNDRDQTVRAAVVASLGGFTDAKAVQAVVRALSDPNELIRATAAKSLGQSKTGDAVDALIQRLPDAQAVVAEEILRAMGTTQSPKVFPILEEALSSKDVSIRRAALEGIVNFGPGDAVGVLERFTDDDDMDFREQVVRQLAEKFHQPIDPQWLVAVIQSRKKANSIGDAPRLLRLYTEDLAALTLLSCLDFENPDIRSYYNLTIMDNQLACNGLAVPWISDLNRDATHPEIEQNQRTLKQIKAWVSHFEAHPWREPLAPGGLPISEEEATWGNPKDDLVIRARTNRTVWPQGLPQVITIEAMHTIEGGSVTFEKALAICEVEVNDEWYSRDPKADTKVTGEWHAYHGHSAHDLQLDDRWRRKSDNAPLNLKPDKYQVRVRLSTTPKPDLSDLATSKPIEFEVIPTDAKR